MIDLSKLEVTSLVTIINEISKTNKLLDDIDLILDTRKLQPHEVEGYIQMLKEQEEYYKALENEIQRRWGFNISDELKKVK